MPSNEEFYNLKAQRDLLFAGLKKIATDANTPNSIKIYLNSLAKKVLETKSKVVTVENNKPFEVGDIVTTTNNKICRYRIEKIYNELGATLTTLPARYLPSAVMSKSPTPLTPMSCDAIIADM